MVRLGLLAVALALVVAGCGVQKHSTPAAAEVALVGSDAVTGTQVAGLLDELRRSFKARGRVFPATTDPYYADLQDEAVRYLVERRLREQVAARLGIEISEGDVEHSLRPLDASDRTFMRENGLATDEQRRDARDHLVDFETYRAIARSRKSGETVHEALARR